MAETYEVTFRIPSRTVQYGYIETRVPATPDASPEMLAAQYVSFVYAFQKEEEAAIQRIKAGVSQAPEDVHERAQEALSGLETTVLEETPTEGAEDAQPPWQAEVPAKPKPWEIKNKKPVTVVDVGDDW